MLIQRLAGCFIVAALVSPAKGAATVCPAIFLDGQPPALLNPKLDTRATLLCNDAYAVLASGVTHGALWSAEHLTAATVTEAEQTPREGRFHADDRLALADRAELADYRRSSFDRGHMTPSGDMPDPVAQEQSFLLSNMVPQTPTLNRGVWERIETVVRALALRDGELFVVTGPAFRGAELRAIGDDGVLVPSSTWKAVYDPHLPGAGVYVCRNTATPTCQVVTVATLQRVVGIDPFPALGTNLKTAVAALPVPRGPGWTADDNVWREPRCSWWTRLWFALRRRW